MSSCEAVLVFVLAATQATAAELKPATVAAFDRYVQLTEARIDREVKGSGSFLLIDGASETVRRQLLAEIQSGKVHIERLATRDEGKEIRVPNGLIHHWLGIAFIPGATIERTVSLLRDYDRHAEVYKPAIVKSKTLEANDGHYKVFLRFFMKKIISVTMNTEHDAQFVTLDPARTYSSIRSTRIAEVADAGKPTEHEMPVGRDNGFMWRLNTYWRFAARDGGTYIQCESVTLSRDIPFGLGWLVGGFVTSIPRESLNFMMERTRAELTR